MCVWVSERECVYGMEEIKKKYFINTLLLWVVLEMVVRDEDVCEDEV